MTSALSMQLFKVEKFLYPRQNQCANGVYTIPIRYNTPPGLYCLKYLLGVIKGPDIYPHENKTNFAIYSTSFESCLKAATWNNKFNEKWISISDNCKCLMDLINQYYSVLYLIKEILHYD